MIRRDRELDLHRIAGEFLAQGHGSRVLQVGTADFDDVLEGLCLLVQGMVQVPERWKQALLDFTGRRNVHGRRKDIVRGLAHIDVVVRVHGFLATTLIAQPLIGEVRQDLVHVHIGLGA